MQAALQLAQALARMIQRLGIGNGVTPLTGGFCNDVSQKAVEVNAVVNARSLCHALEGGRCAAVSSRGSGLTIVGISRAESRTVVRDFPGGGGHYERTQVRPVAGFIHADQDSHDAQYS